VRPSPDLTEETAVTRPLYVSGAGNIHWSANGLEGH
jgi:hypothetical protein